MSFHVITYFSGFGVRCATLTVSQKTQRIVAQVCGYDENTYSVYLQDGQAPRAAKHGFTSYDDALNWAQDNAQDNAAPYVHNW